MLFRSHNSGNFEPYLEELVFLFGRYLLICSSRVGGFPAHLQGIWNAYEVTPWSGGFWHNINLQMNYWPAFNTNLIDLFTSYADYNEAFRPAARLNADTYLGEPLINTNVRAAVGQGLNGWAIGTGTWPYRAERPQATGHSGPGTGGMTTSLFWEYYDFSRDTTLLKNAVYPAISEMANFLSKTLVKGRDAFLVRESASPEIVENNPNHTHDHHYRTIGAAFDQQMVYDVYETTLRGMEVLRDTYTPAELEGLLGFDQDLFNRAYANYGNMPVYSDPLGSYNPAVLNNPSGTLGNIYTDFEDLLRSQIDYLDPVIIGKSGQIKEFREEEYYGQIGDPTHRHISHLIGLYPGTVINSDTPHWFDAAKITLNGRGDGGTGWAIGHKLNFWARMYDGNRSYVLLRNLIRTSIYDNLLGSHAPFQIDASFGATSGIAEMLLNSHEGYISLLPSRPDQWATGSFAGLTARGAFEVDASWTNHQADRFVIRSKAGEEATLRYFNIAGATVTDQDGKTVQLTAEGTDFITFDTIAGGEYTVTNIPEYTKTESPSNLTLTNSRAGIHMEWQASPDAASYNIYVAEGSQPDYTFLANAGEELNFTVSKTATYADGFTFSDDADQYTFRVTAVAANGRECDGIIHIITPPLTPTAANGIFSNDNVLAVNVTAAPAPSYATIIPNSYKLYERNGAEYAEIAHSDYPVLYAIDTDSAKEYYVAEWNAFSGESGMVRIAIAESLPGSDNIFLGNVPTISFRDDAEIGTTHGSPKNLTNGSRSTARTDDQDTRYELNNTNWNENIMPGGGSDGLNYTRRYFHADFSLAGEESFESITILDWDGTPSHGPLGFDAASDTNFLNSAFSFSLLQNGVWTVVPSSQWTRTQEVTQITPPNSDRPRGERTIEHTFTFNPPLVGDNIRITMGGTPQNRAPSIIHIEGKTLPPVMTNKFALLGLIHDADSVDRQTGFGINWPTAERSQYTIAKQNALTALTSNAADQARIDQSFGDLQDILDQADGLSRAALADLIRQAEQYIEDRSGIEREVAEALIQPALTQAIAIDTAAPQAELDQVHLALHRLSRSFDRADDDIAARIELMDLIEEAKEFIATKIDTESLLHIEELADRISDALDYAETVSAQANPMASLHEILFATRELIATMAAYETAINAELTLSSSGGIFTTSANLTLQCTNSRITDFYYTIDGTDPTPQSDKVSGMVIPLPDGAYTLKAAGFIGTDRVTGIAEGNFFAVKTSNVARGSEATGTGSPFGGDMGPASAVDGNYNSRWATSDASTLTLDLGSVRSVSAVIIREFVEPTQDQRLGNYNIQYLDGDEWETAVSGTGSAARGYQGANYAAATGFVPESITNGLVLREGERHKTYALAFPEAVTSQYFRFNTGAPGATIWEVELYEAPSDDSALADLTISTGELTPEFDSEIYSYSVSVPQATSSITITATARNGGAVVFGAGLRNLVHGENIIDITVTAQDGTSQTVYKIAVTRDNPPAAYRKGDADGDVWITVNDILTVRDHILGKQLTNPQALDAADANSDGIINIFDLLTIRNMIVRERTTQN